MPTIQIPTDFKEFLQLLNSNEVEYLLVGGYAVSAHGYPRPTGDMDIWVARNSVNAGRIAKALREFGFSATSAVDCLFLEENRVVQLGIPPMRIDILMSVSGIDFGPCFAKRSVREIDGVTVNLICRDDLIANKRASGRHKDLDDLQNLPS